ncbi:GIY-YIG nuclease family protein [Candidatus Microgenomates bacterium]|nr:MAG: GIY-YIG nuclease family protein [Candidatus Microgenomates bacterium]
MSQWKWYVYVLLCKDQTYYTGNTWCIANRLEQHLSGLGGKYTQVHGVEKLVYAEEHTDFETALYREKQIKKWSKYKKEKLIRGEWGKE